MIADRADTEFFPYRRDRRDDDLRVFWLPRDNSPWGLGLPFCMGILLTFAILLFAGVLISCRAQRSVLSTSALFLGAALLLGRFHMVQAPGRTVLYHLAEIALFSVLFSDGMKTGGLSMLGSRWRPVSRVLLVGMPLSIAILAVFAHFALGLNWRGSAVMGSALSPTDPVFVAAIFAVDAVPQSVKETLSIESGFNDGLALPAIFLLVPQLMGANAGVGAVILELVTGIGIGIALPWLAIKVEELPFFGATGVYERLYPFAIALLLYATCKLANGNIFLAAFTAGITIATLRGGLHEAFAGFSKPVTELLKLATILIFGLHVGGLVLSLQPWQYYLVAVLAAFVVRLLAVPVTLVGSPLCKRERLLIGWFGPKGFASVVYGIMLLDTRNDSLHRVATVVALAVVFSILGYSSTDVLTGNWLKRRTESAGAQPELEKADSRPMN